MSEALGSVPCTAKKNRAEGLVAWLKWYSPYQQVKGLEFNPQYHQKKKKKKRLCFMYGNITMEPLISYN
jgi:hypothetical protein